MTRRTHADALLSELPEFNVGLALPDVVSARLDALVEKANAAGARTSRKELIASLVLAAEAREEELGAAVRRYRTARARDTLVDGGADVTILNFAPRKPGPRVRRSTTAGARARGRS